MSDGLAAAPRTALRTAARSFPGAFRILAVWVYSRADMIGSALAHLVPEQLGL